MGNSHLALLAEVDETDSAVVARLSFSEALATVLTSVLSEAVWDGLSFELESLLVLLRLGDRAAEGVEADEVDAVAG